MLPVVTGYHGCGQDTYEKVTQHNAPMKESSNDYDWLGSGVYFWQDSEARAWIWANECKSRGSIKDIAVIKASIDLRNCLDLLQEQYREELKQVYKLMKLEYELSKKPLPINMSKLHNLDCAVINHLHQFRKKTGDPPYDTVRAVFQEGNSVYPGSRIMEKDHIQIAVRSQGCITVQRSL